MIFQILLLAIMIFFIYNLGIRIVALEKKAKQTMTEKNDLATTDKLTENKENLEIVNNRKNEMKKLKDDIGELGAIIAEQNRKIENLEKEIIEIQKKLQKKTENFIDKVTEEKKTEKIKIEVIKEKKEVEKKVLFENKKNHEKVYFKVVDKLKAIEEFLKKSQDSEAELYFKLIDQYRDSLERVNKKINLVKIDEDEYSEDVTYKFSYVIERDFLRILTSITKGEKLKNREFYREFKNQLEQYMENIGFYKRKELKIMEGEALNENSYAYMELFRVNTEDKSLDKKIKEIDLDPYFIKFYDDNGEEKEYATKGKLSVYIVKE